MARITCQAVFKPGRITLIWSEGSAFFEPYHLEGAEADAVERLTRTLRQKLAQAVHGAAEGGGELAAGGHDLYRAIFRLDSTDAAAQAAHAWFQSRRGEIAALEIVTNAPGRIAWTLVCEEKGDDKAFWGLRYPIAESRRVCPLHTVGTLQSPTVLLMQEEKGGLRTWAEERQLPLVATSADFVDALTDRSSDILYVCARTEAGELHWRDGRMRVADLVERIAQSEKGNASPLLILALSGAADAVDRWECLLGALGQATAAVVVPQTPLSVEAAQQMTARWLPAYFAGGVALGEALRRARAEAGLAGLAWTAFAPARLAVDGPDDGALAPTPRPLPEQPYASMAPLDREQRMFLAGRDEDIKRCAAALDDPATRGLIVHGAMSTGKTSFLRAGLLPYLEEEAIGFRALRDRSSGETEEEAPVLALRTGPDLLGQLCQGLAYFAARPLDYATPAGNVVRVDLAGYASRAAAGSMAVRPGGPNAAGTGGTPLTTGAGEIDTTPAQWAQRLYQLGSEDPSGFVAAVDQLTRRLPWEVVFVLEQADDLAEGATETARKRRRLSMELLERLLASPARLKVVLSVRSDALAALSSLLPSGQARAHWREFFLPPLSKEALEHAMLLPTDTERLRASDSAPNAKYGFSFEEGLAERMVADVLDVAGKGQLAPLPLLQCLAAQMYQRMRSRGEAVLRPAAYRRLEPLVELPGKTVDEALSRQKVGRADGQRLLDQMVRLESDGRCRRELRSLRSLAPSWPGGAAALEQTLDLLSESEPPLVEIQQFLVGGEPDTHVSVASDGVAQARRRAIELKEKQAYGRSRVIDTLWIMVPLAALAAAISFFFTRRMDNVHFQEAQEEFVEKVEKAAAETRRAQEEVFTREFHYQNTALQWAQYGLAMNRANAALAEGDLIEVRKAMFSILPMPGDRERGMVGRLDLRGFDWYHLWRRMHPERYALLGHRAPISALAISPDGKLLASASLDGMIKLWSRETLLELQTIAGEKTPVLCLAFSADGKLLAAGRKDKLVLAWRLDGEKLAAEPAAWTGHDAAVVAIASATDEPLVSVDAGGKVIAWDAAKGVPAPAAALPGPVRGLVYTKGAEVAALGEKGKVSIFRPGELAANKEMLLRVDTPLSDAAALAYSKDRGLLAVAGVDAKSGKPAIAFVDASGKASGPLIEVASPVRALAWAPGKNALIVGARDKSVSIHDRDGGKVASVYRSHLGWINAVAAGPEGLVLTGGEDAHVKVWSLRPDFEPSAIKVDGEVAGLAFVAGGKALASGDARGFVRFLDPATGLELGKISRPGQQVAAMAVKHEKGTTTLAVGFAKDKDTGSVVLIEAKMDEKNGLETKEIETLPGLTRAPAALAFGAEGRMLVVAGKSGSIDLWEFEKKAVRELEGIKAEPAAAALAAGDIVVVTTTDGEIALVDGRLGKKLVMQKGHAGSIPGLAELPMSIGADVRFATSGADGVLRFWSWRDGKLVSFMTRNMPGAAGCNLARSPKTPLWLLGLGDGVQLTDVSVRVGMIETHDRAALRGAPAPARRVAINPAETVIAAALADGTIRFWRAATPEETVNPRPR